MDLKKCPKNSHLFAPGSDGITYPMIKHLSQNSLKNLFQLYNRIFPEHVFPNAWHDAILLLHSQNPVKMHLIQKIIAQSHSQAVFVKSSKKGQ